MPRTGAKQETGFARDLDILEAVSQAVATTRYGLRLTEIAERTGREKSQVSRALSRMEQAGLVARDSDERRFVPGWRLFHLAARTAEARLLTQAQPVMRDLVVALGETVHLCVLRGTSCVTLHSEVPNHGFRGLSWIGVEAPAHVLTAGRVLLAECGDAELRERYPYEELPDVPPSGQVRTRAVLLEECETIRRRGYAVVDEEFEPGLVGASAAVHDFRGIAVASLNVAAPKARLGSKLDALGQRLHRAAAELSTALGDMRPRPSRLRRPGVRFVRRTAG